jgi:purine-nucleoside phosphorylase
MYSNKGKKFVKFTLQDYQTAAAVIRQRIPDVPVVGIVLGSGLGPLVEAIENPISIPYEDIPNWPRSTVHGHKGQLIVGYLEGKLVLVQQGRAHFYEGYTMPQVTFPIRVMYFLGIKTAIVTNAAGGVNRDFDVADVMLINDHINLVGMAGFNALSGPNEEELGERFVGLVRTYDEKLRKAARQVAEQKQIPLREGVYMCVSGPTFETPAEIRMCRTLGADAVGMSTVHEVIVARHMGMRVMACSGITNIAADSINIAIETNHHEVLEAGQLIVPRLIALVRGVVATL